MTTSNIINKIKPSATLALSSKVKQLKSEGMSVIGFGAGEPDFDTPEDIKNSQDPIVQQFIKGDIEGPINIMDRNGQTITDGAH